MITLADIAAGFDAATPMQRPEIPARVSAPKDKTGGRRQAAAPNDLPSNEGEKSDNPHPSHAEAGDGGKPSPSDASSSGVSAAPPHPQQGEESAANPRNDDKEAAEEEKPAALSAEDLAALIALVDRDKFDECAQRDQSDTDNAHRLLAYVGRDLLVRAEEESDAGSFLVWTGTHWDVANGKAGALKLAQRVGDLIKEEVDFIVATDAEARRIEKSAAAQTEIDGFAEKALLTPADEQRIDDLMAVIKSGERAQDAIYRRRAKRREWAVGAKNGARIKNMLTLASPHLRRLPDAFNPDPLMVVTRTHTLRFSRTDIEHREEGEPLFSVAIDAQAKHRRDDLVTAMVPVAYDPKATCPKWLANMERFQPDAAQRRTVQQFAGLGMTGLPIQRLMYHTGTGGNFKSVFLETITRVLGESLSVGLPATAIAGFATPGAGSQPTPELARVYGKRTLRVLELPVDQPLKADLIKKLTGGERFPVRTLFKGFFEFTPQAKVHMSGNGEPTFDGSDGGMKRRILLVKWPVTIPESEQRDFEEVVSELVAEGPGILNWLIAGLVDYLANGFFVAPSVQESTRSYVDQNDPVGQFDHAHVESAPGEDVGAREMFVGFCAWAAANSKKEITETRFGLVMKKKREFDDTGRKHLYKNVRLHDVPDLPPKHRFAKPVENAPHGAPAGPEPPPHDEIAF